MPRDALYEESAQPLNSKKQARWYTAFHVLFIVFGVLAVIHLFVCIMVLPGGVANLKEANAGGLAIAFLIIMWLAPLLALALTSFLFFRLRLRFNVSYDYIFVTDELRITKVFNGRKRKHMITLEADHILQIGYCESESFERTCAGMERKKQKFMTPNREPAEGKEFIYILNSSSLGKTMYIIECRKEMLEHLVFAAGRNKFVRE